MFLDHTQRCSTVGRTPLDEWSARRRDLYLTTHDTHNRHCLLALLGAHHFLHVSRIRVKSLTLRLLVIYIYIYGAPILNVSRSHRPQAAHLLRSWVRIPPGAWIFVCCECRVLSSRGLCDELITRPEESYRLCCVVVCDLETTRMGAPYIYNISRLRVNELGKTRDRARVRVGPALQLPGVPIS